MVQKIKIKELDIHNYEGSYNAFLDRLKRSEISDSNKNLIRKAVEIIREL